METTVYKERKERNLVEARHNQVIFDVNEIRTRLNIERVIPAPQDLLTIDLEAHDITKKGRPYPVSEICNQFMADHVVASIKLKLPLSEDEERTLRLSVFGDIFQSPNEHEYHVRAGAANYYCKEYSRDQKRNQQIFNTLKEEFGRFLEMVPPNSGFSDPVARLKEIFSKTADFDALRTYWRDKYEVLFLLRQISNSAIQNGPDYQ